MVKQDKKKLMRQQHRIEFYKRVDEGSLTPREAVKLFRKVLGMNQIEFAQWANVPKKTLLDFEQGKGNPTMQTLEKMLKGSGLELKVGRKSKNQSQIS